MMRLHLNQWVKARIASLLSSPVERIEYLLYATALLFLPTQLGKHFWPEFSSLLGRKIDYLSPTLYLTDIFIVLLFVVWGKRHAGRLLYMMRIRPAILLFSSLVALGALFAVSQAAAFYGVLKLLEFSFFGYYTASVVSGMKEAVGKIVFVTLLFESLLALFQFVLHRSLGGIFYWVGERTFTSSTPGIANAAIDGELILRPYATFPHPNVLAAYLLIAILITVEWLIIPSMKRLNRQSFLLLGASLGAAALFMTLSRIAIVFFLVYALIRGLSLMLVFKGRQKAIVAAIVSVTALFSVFFFLRFGSRFLVFQTESSLQERLDFLHHGIELLFHYPLFGVGINNYLFHLADSRMLSDGVAILQPIHNIFLLFVVQLGIPAGVFILLFLKRTFERVRLLHAATGEILPPVLLLCVAVLGSVDHYFITLQQGQLFLALLLGICWQKARQKTIRKGATAFHVTGVEKSSKKQSK